MGLWYHRNEVPKKDFGILPKFGSNHNIFQQYVYIYMILSFQEVSNTIPIWSLKVLWVRKPHLQAKHSPNWRLVLPYFIFILYNNKSSESRSIKIHAFGSSQINLKKNWKIDLMKKKKNTKNGQHWIWQQLRPCKGIGYLHCRHAHIK